MNYRLIINLFLLTLASCAEKAEKVKLIRVGFVMAEGGAAFEGAQRFQQLVDSLSSGTLEVVLFPNAQLGKEREITEGLALGSVDIAITGPSPIAWYLPEYGVLEAPFVFRNFDHLDLVLDGKIGNEIKAALLQEAELYILTTFHRGARYLTTTNKKVTKPSDLAGLKLRVPELPTYITSWKQFGANPTPLPVSDLFMALRQGVVDGQENPLELIYTSHLYEVQKYIMNTEHLISFYPVLTSQLLRQKLTPSEWLLVEEAAMLATEYQNLLVDEYSEKFKSELKSSGMIFIDVDQKAFQQIALQQLPPMFSGVWREGIFDEIQQVK